MRPRRSGEVDEWAESSVPHALTTNGAVLPSEWNNSTANRGHLSASCWIPESGAAPRPTSHHVGE